MLSLWQVVKAFVKDKVDNTPPLESPTRTFLGPRPWMPTAEPASPGWQTPGGRAASRTPQLIGGTLPENDPEPFLLRMKNPSFLLRSAARSSASSDRSSRHRRRSRPPTRMETIEEDRQIIRYMFKPSEIPESCSGLDIFFAAGSQLVLIVAPPCQLPSNAGSPLRAAAVTLVTTRAPRAPPCTPVHPRAPPGTPVHPRAPPCTPVHPLYPLPQVAIATC